jgi:hypothetical protein
MLDVKVAMALTVSPVFVVIVAFFLIKGPYIIERLETPAPAYPVLARRPS